MSEKQKTLAYTLDGKEVRITVSRASAKMGVKRALLAGQCAKENESETDEAVKILRLMFYPDIISATTEVEGMEFPVPFEQLIELPEELVNDWAQAIYDVNPQWKPGRPENEDPLPERKTSG